MKPARIVIQFMFFKQSIILNFFFFQFQGAQTIIHCAVSDEVKNESGLFYRDCKVYNSQANLSPTIASKLWELSCKLCRIEW